MSKKKAEVNKNTSNKVEETSLASNVARGDNLLTAINSKDIEEVKKYLDTTNANYDLEEVRKAPSFWYTRTPLLRAINKQDLPIIKLIQEAGGKINTEVLVFALYKVVQSKEKTKINAFNIFKFLYEKAGKPNFQYCVFQQQDGSNPRFKVLSRCSPLEYVLQEESENNDLIKYFIENFPKLNLEPIIKILKEKKIKLYHSLLREIILRCLEQTNFNLFNTLINEYAELHKESSKQTTLFETYHLILNEVVNQSEPNFITNEKVYNEFLVQVTENLLKRNANPNYEHPSKGLLLPQAIQNGRRDIAQLLLNKGGNVNQVSKFGALANQTPLIIAVKNKDLFSCRLLIKDFHADLNLKYNGKTAFEYIFLTDDPNKLNWIVPLMNFFIEAGVSPNSKIGEKPLVFCAIEVEDETSIQYFLTKKLILNSPEINLHKQACPIMASPLSLAISLKKPKIAKMLLPHTDETNRQLSIHYAVTCSDGEMLDLLIANTKNTFWPQDSRVHSPLAYAIIQKNEGMAGKLITANRFLEWTDPQGRNALLLAIENNLFETVKLILAKNPNLNVSDNQGRNALHYASAALDHNILKMVLDILETQKGDINSLDNHNANALIHALRTRKIGNAGLLLSKNIKLNIITRQKTHATHELFKLFNIGFPNEWTFKVLANHLNNLMDLVSAFFQKGGIIDGDPNVNDISETPLGIITTSIDQFTKRLNDNTTFTLSQKKELLANCNSFKTFYEGILNIFSEFAALDAASADHQSFIMTSESRRRITNLIKTNLLLPFINVRRFVDSKTIFRLAMEYNLITITHSLLSKPLSNVQLLDNQNLMLPQVHTITKTQKDLILYLKVYIIKIRLLSLRFIQDAKIKDFNAKRNKLIEKVKTDTETKNELEATKAKKELEDLEKNFKEDKDIKHLPEVIEMDEAKYYGKIRELNDFGEKCLQIIPTLDNLSRTVRNFKEDDEVQKTIQKEIIELKDKLYFELQSHFYDQHQARPGAKIDIAYWALRCISQSSPDYHKAREILFFINLTHKRTSKSFNKSVGSLDAASPSAIPFLSHSSSSNPFSGSHPATGVPFLGSSAASAPTLTSYSAPTLTSYPSDMLSSLSPSLGISPSVGMSPSVGGLVASSPSTGGDSSQDSSQERENLKLCLQSYNITNEDETKPVFFYRLALQYVLSANMPFETPPNTTKFNEVVLATLTHIRKKYGEQNKKVEEQSKELEDLKNQLDEATYLLANKNSNTAASSSKEPASPAPKLASLFARIMGASEASNNDNSPLKGSASSSSTASANSTSSTDSTASTASADSTASSSCNASTVSSAANPTAALIALPHGSKRKTTDGATTPPPTQANKDADGQDTKKHKTKK